MDERMTDDLLHRRHFYVDGTWAEPASDERFGVVSPSTER